MITLSNGCAFEYATASGALGFNGRGWPWEWPLKAVRLLDPLLFANVIKTLTLKPRTGNLRWRKPWGCVRLIFDGLKIVGAVNAVGLTNPGIDWWIKKVGPKIRPEENLIASILGEPAELAIMATILNNYNIFAIEVNVSCPNTQDDFLKNAEKAIEGCRAVKRNSRHPILVKLSVANDAERIVPALAGVAEAFSVNSVPWNMIFPYKKSPLAKLGGGGVSGKIAQRFTWAFAEELMTITDIPFIAPSVWDFEDIEKLRDAGFEAFSFGSVFMPFPWRPTLYVRKDMSR